MTLDLKLLPDIGSDQYSLAIINVPVIHGTKGEVSVNLQSVVNVVMRALLRYSVIVSITEDTRGVNWSSGAALPNIIESLGVPLAKSAIWQHTQGYNRRLSTYRYVKVYERNPSVMRMNRDSVLRWLDITTGTRQKLYYDILTAYRINNCLSVYPDRDIVAAAAQAKVSLTLAFEDSQLLDLFKSGDYNGY